MLMSIQDTTKFYNNKKASKKGSKKASKKRSKKSSKIM